MQVSLILSFWFMVAAYVIHVLDDSLLGGSFVERVRQHWWPEYSWRKFFWFNTGYFAVMIASVMLYDLHGGEWVGCPSARLGPGKATQWALASLVDHPLRRIFARIVDQHSYGNECLLHRTLPPSRGTPCAPHIVAGSAHRIACRQFFIFLLSSGKRQKEAPVTAQEHDTLNA
jgi:hypothetical protein